MVSKLDVQVLWPEVAHRSALGLRIRIVPGRRGPEAFPTTPPASSRVWSPDQPSRSGTRAPLTALQLALAATRTSSCGARSRSSSSAMAAVYVVTGASRGIGLEFARQACRHCLPPRCASPHPPLQTRRTTGCPRGAAAGARAPRARGGRRARAGGRAGAPGAAGAARPRPADAGAAGPGQRREHRGARSLAHPPPAAGPPAAAQRAARRTGGGAGGGARVPGRRGRAAERGERARLARPGVADVRFERPRLRAAHAVPGGAGEGPPGLRAQDL